MWLSQVELPDRSDNLAMLRLQSLVHNVLTVKTGEIVVYILTQKDGLHWHYTYVFQLKSSDIVTYMYNTILAVKNKK